MNEDTVEPLEVVAIFQSWMEVMKEPINPQDPYKALNDFWENNFNNLTASQYLAALDLSVIREISFVSADNRPPVKLQKNLLSEALIYADTEKNPWPLRFILLQGADTTQSFDIRDDSGQKHTFTPLGYVEKYGLSGDLITLTFKDQELMQENRSAQMAILERVMAEQREAEAVQQEPTIQQRLAGRWQSHPRINNTSPLAIAT